VKWHEAAILIVLGGALLLAMLWRFGFRIGL